jgi:hypothetical protein
MMDVLATAFSLITLTALIVWLTFNAGLTVPLAGYVSAVLSFVIVVGLWILIAIDPADGPGGALGVSFASVGSLLILGAGIGFVAGAMESKAPILGLVLGLACSCVLHLWLVRQASPWIGTIILLACCVTGIAAGYQKKKC